MSPPDKPDRSARPEAKKSSGPLFRRDDYQDAVARPREAVGEAAIEVSQGAWRERAFAPRSVMPAATVLAGLEQELAAAAERAVDAGAVSQLARDWLPLLRQAVEQGGGDGLDAWLLRALKPPGRPATSPLFDALAAGFEALRGAADAAALRAGGAALIAAVGSAFEVKKRVSLKVLERELDGKLEVDELIAVRLATADELEARAEELEATLDTLREQVKVRPGARPDGIYANHARLKAELRVVQAERALRNRP